MVADRPSTGLIVGRFCPPHLGHSHLIDRAAEQVDELVVFVNTRDGEVVPGDLRAGWLAELHPDVTVVEVRHDLDTDFGDEELWARWIALFQERWPLAGDGPAVVFSSDPYAAELARRLGAAVHRGRRRPGRGADLGHPRAGAAGRPPRLPGPSRADLGGGDVADEVTPAPSWISKWWPSLVVAAVTAAAWFVLAPWDWSTVDAAGHERTGATGDAWAALIGVALVSGMAVATVVRRRPDAVLRAPLAGLATFIVLYAWRASQARVKGGNLWPLGLIGVVLPIGLLGTFGGSWLALRTIRARNREREQRGDGAEP